MVLQSYHAIAKDVKWVLYLFSQPAKLVGLFRAFGDPAIMLERGTVENLLLSQDKTLA
jgi:hypothetical protein